MKDKIKECKEKILEGLGAETTNHIIIQGVKLNDYGKAEDLFYEIQNDFRFYDNCVFDSDGESNNRIIIELKNPNQTRAILKEIRGKYKWAKNSYILTNVPIKDTIIEPDRKDETGGFEV